MKKVTARVKSLEKILASSEIDVYREEGVYFSKGFAWNFKMNENIGKTIELTKDTRDWIHYDYAGVDDKHGYKKEWLEDITEAVDWDEVEIDATIVVWDENRILRKRMHFAGMSNEGYFTAWDNGATSWSVNDRNAFTIWKHAELLD